ncbi:MAG: nitroreductase/quinone reductase family protein [Myxococcota bacterium]
MKAFKWIVILFVVYVGIVAAFESLLGTFQPTNEGTLVLTTYDPDGTAHDRVLTRVEGDGTLYVSVNHWPRAWYRRVLATPDVQVTVGETTENFTAVAVEGAEHDQLAAANPHPFVFRLLTGFPPRHFVRLDPR